MITLENAHGKWTTTAENLDRIMAHYLPAAPNGLRAHMEEIWPGDYSDVRTVTEFLVMLAHITAEQGVKPQPQRDQFGFLTGR